MITQILMRMLKERIIKSQTIEKILISRVPFEQLYEICRFDLTIFINRAIMVGWFHNLNTYCNSLMHFCFSTVNYYNKVINK